MCLPWRNKALETNNTMNREERRIIGLTTASHSLVHLYENVLPPLIPLLTVFFNTDYFHLGLVVTVFSYAFGLGSLPSGILADRLGPRRLVTLYLFGSGVLSVLIWFSGTLRSYAVFMGILGLFCSIYHPASNTLISQAVRQRGKAFGIHGIAGSLGVAVAPALAAWIGSAAGWKAPHILFGVLGVMIGFYSLSFKAKYPVSATPREADTSTSEPVRTSYLNFIIFFLAALSLGLSYKGIMTFLPTYMGESVDMRIFGMDSVSMGGMVATFALLSGALGQYLAGRLVDRYQPERIYFTVVAVGTVFVFIMAASSNFTLILSAVVYAFLYFATQPTQNFILAKYTPSNRHGLVFGLHFFLMFGVGSTAAAASGYLADHLGLSSVFYAMGGCFAFSSVLLLWLAARTASHGAARGQR